MISRCLVVSNMLAFMCFMSPLSADLNAYDYYKRVSPGKEKLYVPAYKGVPAKTRRDLKKAMTQAYKHFGKRPIAPTYALFWHSKKSKLSKVSSKWCKVNGDKNKRCLTEGGGWDKGFKNENISSGGFSDLSHKGLIEGTEGWWRDNNDDDKSHIRIAAHEYFHVYQHMLQHYFETEKRFGIPKDLLEGDTNLVGPVWMVEGGADYFAYNILAKNGWFNYKKQMKRALLEARDEIKNGKKKGIVVNLKNYSTDTKIDKIRDKEFFAHFQYDGGAWANAYLRYLKGTNKGVFTNYYKDIAELERTWRKKGKSGYGWKKSFQKNFGMTVNKFYTKFNRFMKWPVSKQMKILKAPGV